MVKSEFREPFRRRAGWLLGAIIVLPVTGVVLPLLKLPIPAQWNWVIACLAAVATASPSAIDLWRESHKPHDELAAAVRTNLGALTQRGGLQRVGEVGDLLASLGLKPSKIAEEAAGAGRPPPYVPRENDSELHQKLSKSPFVLAIGPSKAGKSRSAAEAMRKILRSRWLVVPETRGSLQTLLDRGFDFSNSVVWLDDLEQKLDVEALGQLLRKIRRSTRQTTILATMRSKPLESYMPSGGDERPEWLALKEADIVRLKRKLNADERKAAHDAYDDARLDEALERHGLAEYLAAGPDLVKKLETGASTNPVGRAAVLAAVDWYRVGLARPVPKPTLKRLYPAYLGDDDVVGLETATGNVAFESGLGWAEALLYETSALLTQEGASLVPFAYLLDYVEDEPWAIPASTWDVALQAAKGGSEAFAIGEAALSHGEFDVAERGLRKAATGHDSLVAAPAAFSLGKLYEGRGQEPMASHWYREAADAGHAGAMYRLGELAEPRDPVEAGTWYQRAAETGNADAMCRLGELAEGRDIVQPERSYLAEAEHWYRRAAELGHHGAKGNLERLLADRHTAIGNEARGHRGEERASRRCRAIVLDVNKLEPEMEARTDAELRELTDAFRQRLADGETLDHLLPEAFAAVREAAKRTIGKRHYDVQLMAGAALHWGMVAEVKDGEGKTLVATLPSYLNALTGKGVHVVMLNDYLAKRDAAWMGPIYRCLGLEIGVIFAQMTAEERRKQYAADITYGTSNEFGFGYLRDNMAWSLDECVQRGHIYAIVDEVDSVFIDEARVPLNITGPTEQSARWYTEFAKIAPRLRRSEEEGDGGDYEVDEKKRTVGVLESGAEKVEDWLSIDNLYDSVNTPLVSFLNNAINAKELYKRDKDYVVINGEVLIVDKFTGRILHGRRYDGGLHQAIEAKEGVVIQPENQPLATITLQNYFRLYDKLAGMTGTAMTEANEFHQIYKLGVVPIPTNKPMKRVDYSDAVYQTAAAKFDAVVDDIAERYEAGQPVLVGTTSVEKSELLSRLLKRRGVPHEVLNAKNHEREAAIIAQAGRAGAVTVVPAMAGRGVDITLGGNTELLADMELRQRGLSPVEAPEDYEKAWPGAMEKAWRVAAAERAQVVDAGGLAVLGTERHESRRADNRLRSRAARRGDPGESQFYLSLEDDLMRKFNSDKVAHFMKWLRTPADVPIESKTVSRSIRSAQTQMEQQNFEIRKDVLKYDDVLDSQRQVIYRERRRVLEGEDLHEQIRQMIDEVVTAYVTGATSEGIPEEWDLYVLWAAFRKLYHPTLTIGDVVGEADGDQSELSRDFLAEVIKQDAQNAYDRREEELTPEVMREVERRVVLSVLDRKWREHLYEMDQLREGIGLQVMAQRDPLIEYQREGFDLFTTMMDGIKEESVGNLFNLQVEVQENPIVEEAGGASPAEQVITAGTTAPGGAGEIMGAGEMMDADAGQAQGPTRLSYSAPTVDGDAQVERSSEAPADVGDFRKMSRNDPCPCGSGRMYKLCHGDPRNRPS
jgi:preprotein translocase subunit SecA